MLAVERVEIGPDESRVDLEKRLAVIGANLMLAVVQDLDNFRKNSLTQNGRNVTYGKMFVVET
jgi:methionyl-tRNA formyltransferase